MAIRRIVRQLLPRRNAQIEMILVAALARVVDRDRDCVALAADAVIAVGSGVGQDDLAAAVRARRLAFHPVIAQSDFVLAVAERVAA